MHRHIGPLALVAVLLQTAADERPFRPYAHAGYAFVNAVAFSPDGTALYHASFLDRVARHRGQTLAPGAPELGIFESRRGADGVWGEPALLPFSGRDKDYEPTLSPDGQFMIFNSWRPLPSGPANREGRNNLWLARRRAGGWTDPISLAAVNRPETEESYAAIASDGRVFYVQEVEGKPGGTDWDIYVTRLDGDRASPPTPVAIAATEAGEGDPWVAPDGSYLIFTRWDRAADWQTSVDLFITFAEGSSWTAPAPLAGLNQPNAAEYAVTITNDPEPLLYYRRGGPMVVRPARPVIENARRPGRDQNRNFQPRIAPTAVPIGMPIRKPLNPGSSQLQASPSIIAPR